MIIDSLLSRVFGFCPPAGRHIEESKKLVPAIPPTTAALSPILVFRGIRCRPDQTAMTRARRHMAKPFAFFGAARLP
jgi:hypothetical protein